MKFVLGTVAVLACAGLASAQALTLNGPSAQTFANGGGTGFGGTLGTGSITMAVSGANLDITFTAGTGTTLNNLVTIMLDTRSGGFSDADMNDQQDGGRRAVSNLTRDSNDTFPISPDFGLVFGSFGAVLFELSAGNTPNYLQFQIFNAGTSMSIPLALLGSPTQVDWFAAYVSDSGFNSNESLPNANLGAGNIGFGAVDGTVAYTAFNRYTIPTPGAAALLGLGGLAMVRRRR